MDTYGGNYARIGPYGTGVDDGPEESDAADAAARGDGCMSPCYSTETLPLGSPSPPSPPSSATNIRGGSDAVDNAVAAFLPSAATGKRQLIDAGPAEASKRFRSDDSAVEGEFPTGAWPPPRSFINAYLPPQVAAAGNETTVEPLPNAGFETDPAYWTEVEAEHSRPKSPPPPSSSRVRVVNVATLQDPIAAAYLNKPLPNDNDAETKRLEEQFTRDLIEFTEPDDCDLDGAGGTIIYSRTLRKHFRWPMDRPLTMAALEVFRDRGHTLGVDYTLSYGRMLAFDLDCGCRLIPTDNHLTEEFVDDARYTVGCICRHALRVDKDSLQISVFRSKTGCGFHIYTNVPVSTVSHMVAREVLQSQYSSVNVVIEVPPIMPLPFSAKVVDESYRPLDETEDMMPELPLTMCAPSVAPDLKFDTTEYRVRPKAFESGGTRSDGQNPTADLTTVVSAETGAVIELTPEQKKFVRRNKARTLLANKTDLRQVRTLPPTTPANQPPPASATADTEPERRAEAANDSSTSSSSQTEKQPSPTPPPEEQQQQTALIRLRDYPAGTFVELVEYREDRIIDMRLVGEIVTTEGSIYAVRGDAYLTNMAPDIRKALKAHLEKLYDYMTPLVSYVNHWSRKLMRAPRVSPDDIDVLAGFPPDVVRAFDDYMADFCENFRPFICEPDQPLAPTSREPFVELATSTYDGLYLQPFVVSLFKVCRVDDVDRFRILLSRLFAYEIIQLPSVRMFVHNFTRDIVLAYEYHTSWEMRGHLRFLYIHAVNPLASLDSRINSIAQSTYRHCHDYYLTDASVEDKSAEKWGRFHAENAEASASLIRDCMRSKESRGTGETIIQDTLRAFAFILRELCVYFFDRCESQQFYYLEPRNGAYYETASKMSDSMIPTCVRRWIGNTSGAVTAYNHMVASQILFRQDQMFGVCKSPFLFATSSGVFNSITGMYTAHTPFLKFSKMRNRSIWPSDDFIRGGSSSDVVEKLPPIDVVVGAGSATLQNPNRDEENSNARAAHAAMRIKPGHNDRLVEDMAVVERILITLQTRITELYTHAVLAPALIQLNHVFFINERDMETLFEQLMQFNELNGSFECMCFLVEHIPFDPRLVYLIIRLTTTQGGYQTMYSYSSACQRIFGFDTASVQDWRERFAPDMAAVTWDETRPTHFERLMTLEGPGLDSPPSSTNCTFATFMLACYSKCKTFSTFAEAFDLSPSEIDPKLLHPEYLDFDSKTTVEAAQGHVRRAQRIVFGPEPTVFEQDLINECFCLCMSANYRLDTVMRTIESIGLLYLVTNVKKKLILYYGVGNVGKSRICSRLNEMLRPKVAQFNSLPASASRAVLGEYNGVIVNEVRDLQASELKSVTGNDLESSMQFYTQKFITHATQPILYGATNVAVEFKGRSHQDVDRTTVERLHVIELTGQAVAASNAEPSFFNMMTAKKFFQGTVVSADATSTFSLGWLAYVYYWMTRDKARMPTLTGEERDSYQDRTFQQNSAVYSLIVHGELMHFPGFYIDTTTFLTHVNAALDRMGDSARANGRAITSMTVFKQRFALNYGIDLNKADVIEDFQMSGLIKHVIFNMETLVEPGSFITDGEVTERAALYQSPLNIANAMRYFQKHNANYYDRNTRRFEGIRFVHPAMSAFQVARHNVTAERFGSESNYGEMSSSQDASRDTFPRGPPRPSGSIDDLVAATFTTPDNSRSNF